MQFLGRHRDRLHIRGGFGRRVGDRRCLPAGFLAVAVMLPAVACISAEAAVSACSASDTWTSKVAM